MYKKKFWQKRCFLVGLSPIIQDKLAKIECLKCYYDKNDIFSIEAILRHKQVAYMRGKMLFTILKYLFLFTVPEIFKFLKYAN